MAEISASEQEFTVGDGTRIFTRSWVPAEVTEGAVVIVHGQGEHCGRYDHFARFLCAHGYGVHALDHRGQGRSQGVKGHVDGFEQYTGDLDAFIGRLLEDDAVATDPLCIVGHSMGGLITACYLLEYPDRPIASTAITGPLLKVAVEVPGWKKSLGNVMSNVLPRLRMATGLDAKMLSHDEEIVRAYEEDPLVYGQVSARWFTAMTESMERVHRDAARIEGPLLIAFGEEDGICHPDGSRELYEELQTPDKKLIAYPGMYHEILNETGKQEVYDDVLQWLGTSRGA